MFSMTHGWIVKMPIIRILTVVISVLGLSLSGAWASENSTPPPLADLFGGPFELVDQDGIARSDKDFRGKFMLIYLGYVNCPAICPANLEQMAVALEELGMDAKKVQPIFITLDPARDTPGKLKEFVANFGPEFTGLTGTEAQIQAVVKAYKAIRRKVTLPEQKLPDEYLVFHSTLMHFIGPDGRFLTFFPHNTSGVEMAARMRKYLVRLSSS
jgi:protein SCO1